MNKPSKRRITDASLALLKATFADNEPLLMAMRRLFLQLPLTISDVDTLKANFKGEGDLKALLSDMFNPQIRGDEPFNQVIDLWMTLEVKDKDSESVLLQIKAKKTAIDFIVQQLNKLFDLSLDETIKLKSLIDFDNIVDCYASDVHARVMARNFIVQHVEQQLSGISMLSGTKTETVEQTIARLEKNSTK